MPTITYAPPPLIHSSPSLRSSMRASLFHSLQTFSRFTFAEGSTVHRVCTLFPRGGIPCRWILYLPPTFRYLIRFLPSIFFSLVFLSFFLPFFSFFFSPRTKKNIPLSYFVLVSEALANVWPILSTSCFHLLESSLREDYVNGLIYSLVTEEKGWEKVKFLTHLFFFFFFLAFYHLYS